MDFTTLADEPVSGAQLDFLIGAANETKEQMTAAAKVLDTFKTVVVYDPNDAKALKQLYKEYGVELSCEVVTYTTYVAKLLKDGKLQPKNTGKTVVFQDPYQLSRDLSETEEPREIIENYAVLGEMLLNRDETIWAGNIMMPVAPQRSILSASFSDGPWSRCRQTGTLAFFAAAKTAGAI